MTDFNAWSESVLWLILEVTAQASLCVLIILALQRALGKHLRPNWRHALWSLLLLRLLLPFSYDFTLFAPTLPAKPAPAPASTSHTISSPAITVSDSSMDIDTASDSEGPVLTADTITVSPIPQSAPAIPATPEPFPVAALLFTLWCTGVIAVLAFVVQRHFRLTRAIEREATPASEEVSHLLRRVRDELGVSIWPVVLVSSSIAAPLVVGALRPRILLPKPFADAASPADLRHVLMHELIHVRRRDLVFAWLWLLALALHWFNPIIWWAGARMRRDREQACDQRVLAALPEPERIAYGHTLLKAIAAIDPKTPFNRLAGSAAIVENKAELEGRLTMIRDYRPPRAHHRLFGLVTVLALTTAAFVQVWAVAQEPAKAPGDPAPKTSQESRIPNPYADISDDDQLSILANQEAEKGNLIAACEATMQRVHAQAKRSRTPVDNILLTDIFTIIKESNPSLTDTAKRQMLVELDEYAAAHPGVEYQWRIAHLQETIAANLGDVQGANEYIGRAIQVYPSVKYENPLKADAFHHLVTVQAKLIYDEKGQQAAEDYYVNLWKNEPRFVVWSVPAWYTREAKTGEQFRAFQNRMGDKPTAPAPAAAALIEIKILLTPQGLWYAEKPATMDEIATYLEQIPSRSAHYISLGYTDDDISIKTWQDTRNHLWLLAEKLGFDHISDIGKQPVPAGFVGAAPANTDAAVRIESSDQVERAINKEINLYYSNTSLDVQEFLRATAKSFHPSGLWKTGDEYRARPNSEEFHRDVENLSRVFLEEPYSRKICSALAYASVVIDKRLVPGLMKVAAYHVEDKDYDCRPKWMAISALARQGDERAVPILVPLVDHGNLNTRMWAQAALARITGQAFHDNKQAWADWWNGAGKQPALGPDAVKPWAPPVAKAQ